MSKEPLWTDTKINDLSVPLLKDNQSLRFMGTLIVEDMRDDYERALSFRNEDIGNLRNDLTKLKAQNVQLADSLERVMRERDLAQAQLADTEAILANTQTQRDEAYRQRAEAQKIVTAAVAWYGLRDAIVHSSQDIENYYQKCHDLEMAVLEFGAMQAAQVAPAQKGGSGVSEP